MQKRYFSVLTVITVIGSLTFSYQSVQSQTRPNPGERGFWCDTSGKIPMTLYQNAEGKVEKWIEWRSYVFNNLGYNPVNRCREVSKNFETQRQTGKLKYITFSIKNKLPVVCAALSKERCDGILLTLPSQKQVVPVMSKLLALIEGVKNAPPLRL